MWYKPNQAIPKYVVLAALTVCAGARADLTFRAVGLAVASESWDQAFSLYSSDTPFQTVGLVFTSPSYNPDSGFKLPSWDFTTRGFSNTNEFEHLFTVDRVLTVASGNPTNRLLWESHFFGDKELQDFDLTAFAYNTDPLDGSFQQAVAHWDGTMWDFSTRYGGVTWDEYVAMGGTGDGAVVPVPSAAMLGIVGLTAVGFFRRRILT